MFHVEFTSEILFNMSIVVDTCKNEVDEVAYTQKTCLPRGWMVLKFGGTSVSKCSESIGEIVKYEDVSHVQDIHILILHRASLNENGTVVVCSAHGNKSELDRTTNLLLRAAQAAKESHSRIYHDIVEAVRAEHVLAANRTIQSPEILAKFTKEVNADCEDLVKILDSAQHVGEMSSRAEDKIMGKGETLSSRYVTALLNEQGTPAQLVDLSRVISSCSDPPWNHDGDTRRVPNHMQAKSNIGNMYVQDVEAGERWRN